MSTRPVTVLCITGWCRNGSTIIGNILNEIAGFGHVGELHFLWKNAGGLGANRLCGCGTELRSCPVWSPVLDLAVPGGEFGPGDARLIVARQAAAVRTRHTWRVLRQGPRGPAIREHAALMERTYRQAAERLNARVIVDTSKMPAEGALLAHLPGIRPYFVHLVRDPRAVAQSWRSPKDYVFALSAARSTAYWTGFNLAAGALTRRHREKTLLCRYEDFIAGPDRVIAAILALIGEDPALSPLRGRTVELHGNHTVTGNPDRFRTGPTVIRDHDDDWRSGLPARELFAATLLAWPLAGRYGYRAVGGSRATAGRPSGGDRRAARAGGPGNR